MTPVGKGFDAQFFAYLFLPFLAVFVFTSPAGAQTAGTFITTGNMTTPRIHHTATLLYDGTVLIVGGHLNIPLRSHTVGPSDGLGTTELFDPSTGTFTSSANMITPRGEHTATLLADGRVLIAGGIDRQGRSLASAEIYDPSTAIFTATGSMSISRAGHTATLLNSGRVLIAGGYTGGYGLGSPLAGAELYDPTTGAFTATGDMTVAQATPKAILLPDGKVFIAPGDDETDPERAELFDPDSGTFSRTGWVYPRVFPYGCCAGVAGAVGLLANGKVLVTLQPAEGEFKSHNTALYDVSAGILVAAADLMYEVYSPAGTVLSDGTALVSGGIGSCPPAFASAEIYDAAHDRVSVTGNMITDRIFHTTTLLYDGRVLIAGGNEGGCQGAQPLASAEIYVPSVPLVPVPVVTGLRFDRGSVATAASYSVNFSGPSLTDEILFDVRFIAPGSNDSVVVLNWQKGLVANHSVPLGTTLGNWTINGVRAHQIETDHSGNFFPVSATITVTP
jgi:Galactose oxidase, central domain